MNALIICDFLHQLKRPDARNSSDVLSLHGGTAGVSLWLMFPFAEPA